MVICFHETRETIDLLRRVVDKLDENNGCINAEDLWNGVQCIPTNVRSSNPSVARQNLRQVNRLLDGLKSFASTLVSTYESQISNSFQHVHVPRPTVDSLPNEVIYQIVKDANDWTSREAISLIKCSHISSKFRNVILNSPSLWASLTLTLSMPKSIIASIISRSAALGLTVSLHVADEGSFFHLDSSSALSRLSTMFNHHRRWREVALSLNNDKSAKFIQDHFPLANLSSARVLRICYDGSDTSFFQKWDFPRIEKLSWSSLNALPPSSMATQMLHTCSLSLGPLHASILMNIATFIKAAPGLRTLMMRLSFSDAVGIPEVPKARLSSLEHLAVDFEYNTHNSSTARLLKAILCPGLKRLYIATNAPEDYHDLTKDMRGRYPVLTSLTLAIGRIYPHKAFSFEDILCSLPSTVKKLKIYSTHEYSGELSALRKNRITRRNSSNSYPNLTDLDLEGCNIQEKNFYANISKILSRSCVTLNHFRPGVDRTIENREMELTKKKNAIITLQRAGILV